MVDNQLEKIPTTSKDVIRRGDGFDIGTGQTGGQDDIIKIIQNPSQLANMLNLTEKQAANIRSLLVGAGTGGIHKLLSQQLGDEVAGAIGGLISGYVSRKIFGGK